MVLHLVEKQYHREYTREHMTRLLHKLGFSSQKSRPQNAKKPSDEEIQHLKKSSSDGILLRKKRIHILLFGSDHLQFEALLT